MKVYQLNDRLNLEPQLGSNLEDLLRDSSKTLWIDVHEPDEDSLGQLLSSLKIHPLVLDSCLDAEASPPMATYPGCLFVRVPVKAAWDDPGHAYLALVCTSRALITVHAGEVPVLDFMSAEFCDGMKFRARTVSAMFYQVADLLVDQALAYVYASRRKLEAQQGEPLDGTDPILAVSELKQRVAGLEEMMEDLQLSLNNLQAVQTDFFDAADLRAYFRDTMAHLDSALSFVDRQQARLAELHQRYLLMLQDKANRRLRILTILSAIFMPLTLVTGIYGMNFENMPELSVPYAYPAVLSLMVVTAVVLLLNFYRRGWFD